MFATEKRQREKHCFRNMLSTSAIISIAIAGLFVLALCLAGIWLCSSGRHKRAYERVFGRGNAVRLTEKSKSNPDAKIYASDMDDFMVETNAAAAAIASYYPALIVTNFGTVYKLKTSADADELSHSMMAGIADLWNWGKGICHLVVWAGGLISVTKRNPDYDWRQNMRTQLENLKQTKRNLPTIKKIIEGYKGLVVEDGSSTTMPPIQLPDTPDAFIRAAKSILDITESFIEYRLKAGSLDVPDVDEYVRSVDRPVTWLMWATNDVPISRTTRALMQWKSSMTSEQWSNTWFVIGTGVADSSNVVTPRGSCTGGNTSAMMLKHLVSSEQLDKRVILYSGSNLSFDILPSLLNPQNVSVSIAKNFGTSAYSRMLGTDLQLPNNALSTNFTDFSAKNQAAKCAGSAFTKKKCPFSGAMH